MDPLVAAYLSYLVIGVGLTVWVGQALTSGGKAFLVDVFSGESGLADTVGKLLSMGFYLLSLGYLGITLRVGGQIEDARAAFESVAGKLGWALLVLGAVHLANVVALSRIRRRRLAERHWQQLAAAGVSAAGRPPYPVQATPVAPR